MSDRFVSLLTDTLLCTTVAVHVTKKTRLSVNTEGRGKVSVTLKVIQLTKENFKATHERNIINVALT